MMRTILTVTASVMAVAAISWASGLTLPFNFSPGTTAKSSEVNANFATLKDALDSIGRGISVSDDGGVTITGNLQVNGMDLFTAQMQGTYPAVVNPSFYCSAPTSIYLGTDPNNFVSGTPGGYGNLLFTSGGQFSLDRGLPFLINQTNATNGNPNALGCPDQLHVCAGPVTFFLKSSVAKAIILDAYLDDMGGTIYLDGVQQATYTSSRATTKLTVPSGNFAISFVACSFNGGSIYTAVYNKFITENDLTIDFDRTFHRNGN